MSDENIEGRALWEAAVARREARWYPVVPQADAKATPTAAQDAMRAYLEAQDQAMLKSLVSKAVELADSDPKWWALVMAYAYGKPTEAMKVEIQSTMKRILVTDGKPLDADDNPA